MDHGEDIPVVEADREVDEPADDEARPDEGELRYRVLKMLDTAELGDVGLNPHAAENEDTVWRFMGTLAGDQSSYSTTVRSPGAATLGQTWGAGTYLVLDTKGAYGHSQYEQVTVIGRTEWVDADEDRPF